MTKECPTVRIGTRSSQLALWQANNIAAQLRKIEPTYQVEIIHISTIGDRDRSVPLWEMGGQGVFTKEVQNAILDGRADIAVHSLKDLPTIPAKGLTLAAVPERGLVYDTLVLPKSANNHTTQNENLPFPLLAKNAKIGTSSLRRQAQLKFHRADLEMLDIRGNVETRLQKLDAGEFDAIVLASAGLQRLGFEDRISYELKPPFVYPAVGQGALGLECREDDQTTIELLSRISNNTIFPAVRAERALLNALQAGCHAPVGVETKWKKEDSNPTLHLCAVVLNPEGTERLEAELADNSLTPEELGTAVAHQLMKQGALQLIQDHQR